MFQSDPAALDVPARCAPPARTPRPPQEIDPLAPQSFRLGMPHLTDRGLSGLWFLEAAQHRHRWAVARHLGRRPSEIADITGGRALPTVVACAITGRLDRFSEDDLVTLDLVETPGPATGWRSEHRLFSASGGAVAAEILTVFAARTGPSNRSLAPSLMAPEFAADRDAPGADTAGLLRRRGAASRRAAEQVYAPPQISERIGTHAHLDGAGLVCFAAAAAIFEGAEANALPPLGREWHVAHRELHFFGNMDPGDWLDIHCQTAVAEAGRTTSITSQSVGRRRSDGAVIALCETLRRTG